MSSRISNHLTAFRILLAAMVNNGTSNYSNTLCFPTPNASRAPHQFSKHHVLWQSRVLHTRHRSREQNPPPVHNRLDALTSRLYKRVQIRFRVVGASVLSPTNAASQEAVVCLEQRIVARARAPCYAIVQYYLEYLGSQHPGFELERSARSVVQFEGVLPEAAPRVANFLVDLDKQVGIGVDIPPEVFILVHLVVDLASCLYSKYSGGLRHPLRA